MRLTNNFLLELPARGEYAGRWDIPVNNNFQLIDDILKSLASNKASDVAPTDLFIGQTWFDTSSGKLKINKSSGLFEIVDNENIFVILGGNPIIERPSTLTVPTGIQVTKYIEFGQVNLGVINIEWHPINDESFATFVIKLTKSNDTIGQERFTTATSYKFTGLTPDNINPYIIKIKAIDKQGNATAYSEEFNVLLTDNQSPPQQPGGIVVGGGINRLIVKWTDVSNKDLAGYEVHVSEFNMFEPDCGQQLGVNAAIPDAPAPIGSTTLKYRGKANPTTVSVDKQGTRYYVKVRAYNNAGHFSAFSSQAYANTQLVGSSDIAPLAIDTALIADEAVVNSKIANLDATKITTGQLDAERLGAYSITTDRLHAGGTLKDVAQNKFISISQGSSITNGGPCSVKMTTVGTWTTTIFPSTLMVDLTSSPDVSIDEVEELFFSSYPTGDPTKAPLSYKLDISTDGITFNTVVDVTNNINTEVTKRFTQSRVRFAALTIRAPQPASASVSITTLQIRSRQGGSLITGDTIETGTLTAEHIRTSTLSAIAADLGHILAGTIDMTSSDSYIKSGQTAFNTGKGFWIGNENNTPKFSIGDATGSSIHWDGSTLKITGGVLIGVAPDGTGGTLASGIVNGTYSVIIESTNGSVFKPGDSMSTYLIAHVFQGETEVTDTIDASRFCWRRVSYWPQPPPNDDATWNALYRQGYKQIMITTNTVESRATFHCDILSE